MYQLFMVLFVFFNSAIDNLFNSYINGVFAAIFINLVDEDTTCFEGAQSKTWRCTFPAIINISWGYGYVPR